MLRLTKVAVAAVVGAVAAVITAVGVLGWAFDWQWGDVPTWVEALATVVGLTAAAAGAVGVFRQLTTLTKQVNLQAEALRLQGDALNLQADQAAADRAEAGRRTAQELEVRRVELRRQAEQVEITPTERDHEPPGVNRDVFLVLHVENSSGRPVRNVTCRLILDGAEYTPVEACRFVNPNGTWAAVDRTQRFPILLRRQATADFVFGLVADLNHGATYKLRFTDDTDLHWELTDDMRLIQLDDRTVW